MKITWDETIEDRHVDQRNLWLHLLPDVEKCRILRCYLKDMEGYDQMDTQIQVFVDASRTCSAADVVCSIVMAKSQVAPMKMISIRSWNLWLL